VTKVTADKWGPEYKVFRTKIGWNFRKR